MLMNKIIILLSCLMVFGAESQDVLGVQSYLHLIKEVNSESNKTNMRALGNSKNSLIKKFNCAFKYPLPVLVVDSVKVKVDSGIKSEQLQSAQLYYFFDYPAANFQYFNQGKDKLEIMFKKVPVGKYKLDVATKTMNNFRTEVFEVKCQSNNEARLEKLAQKDNGISLNSSFGDLSEFVIHQQYKIPVDIEGEYLCNNDQPQTIKPLIIKIQNQTDNQFVRFGKIDELKLVDSNGKSIDLSRYIEIADDVLKIRIESEAKFIDLLKKTPAPHFLKLQAQCESVSEKRDGVVKIPLRSKPLLGGAINGDIRVYHQALIKSGSLSTILFIDKATQIGKKLSNDYLAVAGIEKGFYKIAGIDSQKEFWAEGKELKKYFFDEQIDNFSAGVEYQLLKDLTLPNNKKMPADKYLYLKTENNEFVFVKDYGDERTPERYLLTRAQLLLDDLTPAFRKIESAKKAN